MRSLGPEMWIWSLRRGSAWLSGISEIMDIRELERTRKPIRALTIFSPVSGYVMQKTALQGLKVMPGDNLYDIVDLSTVWVLADIYEVNRSIRQAWSAGKHQLWRINPEKPGAGV